MKKASWWLLAAFTVFTLAWTRWPIEAEADEVTTLRIATLAPRDSTWMRVFDAWNVSLRKETAGRVALRFYPGGVAGDERDFIRKIRAGQLDGAAVTSTGLGQVVRPVLVLQAPGLFDSYDDVQRVRRELAEEFEAQFRSAGFELLGWGDAGRTRILSNAPIKRPEDLRTVRPWAWRDDPVFTELLKVVHANPVRLGVPEVYPALQTRMIDTVPASALAAVSLQWHTRVTHVTKQSDGFLIGAMILRKEKFDALDEKDQKILRETGEKAHAVLNRLINRDDQRAYEAMISRGVQPVDIGAYEAQWAEVAKKTRDRLAGRLYPRDLLERVQKIARQ